MFLDLVDQWFTHNAMDSLRAEVHRRWPAEDQRNVRVHHRILNIFSAGNADLQRRGWRTALEGSIGSVACDEADCAANLKAGQSGGTDSGAAIHVPGDDFVGELDVVGVRTLTAFRRIGQACRGSVIGHRHVC